MTEGRTRGGQRQHQESPLKTERGTTTIQDGVVSKVAGIAAQEVDGIRMGGGGASQAVGAKLCFLQVGDAGIEPATSAV